MTDFETGLGLIVLVLAVIALGLLVLTVWAVVVAARNDDMSWIVAILVGWVIGMGWLVGAVYLLTQRDRPRGTPPPPPPTGGPPPGWHPDPTARFEQRYWDGTRWTEHVSRAGVPTTDPLN